ncbi:rhodanese-like domain-containing protein [Hyphomicrobium sp. 99]|uniref:rhodanese-like domain-containing protein n=1 Tax=Hyphomicrobium sp. 99 TaxID=1163419 RepID=UPI0005F7D8AF|nr:rhodanese-like domain-containing protein [Hyphomicrobium sp. 99]
MEKLEASGVEDVPVLETWKRLEGDPKAVLVDVRTPAEWASVGIPDLSKIHREVLLMEWRIFPDGRIDQDFAERLDAVLADKGVEKSTEIFFICRSGVRSRFAAEQMTAAGYRRCHNVKEGFEGAMNASHERGEISGWKFAGLDWVQG